MGAGDQRHAPAALPREKPGTHFIGGWMELRAGLDGYRKSLSHRDLIPGEIGARAYLYLLFN